MLEALSAGASIPAATTLAKRSSPRTAEHATGRPASDEARMTSKTRLDLPLPETPVTAVRTPVGMATSIDAEVVGPGPDDLERRSGRSGERPRPLDAAREIRSGHRAGGAFDLARRAFGDDPAALAARAGSQVEDVVGGPDDVEVVLDGDDGVAFGREAADEADELGRVAGMEAEGRLVQDEGDAGEPDAEESGQPQPLGLAARQAWRTRGRGGGSPGRRRG